MSIFDNDIPTFTETKASDIPLPCVTTREEYLNKAAFKLADQVFKPANLELPDFKVSCSWPGGGSAKKRIGECWARKASSASINEIFISPLIDDSVKALDILCHELVHAIDDCQNGHKGPFVAMCKAIGLTNGKPTQAGAGDVLLDQLQGIVDCLGKYPHYALDLSTRTKQSTRLIKVECNECGCVGRYSMKWASTLTTCGACQCEDLTIGQQSIGARMRHNLKVVT